MTATTASLSATAYQAANSFPVAKVGSALQVYESGAILIPEAQQDEADDTVELFHVPANIRVFAIGITAVEIDDGSNALVYKLAIGSTDVLTGLTTGRASESSINFLATPYTTSAYDKVKFIVTTGANSTSATGSLALRLFYTTV